MCATDVKRGISVVVGGTDSHIFAYSSTSGGAGFDCADDGADSRAGTGGHDAFGTAEFPTTVNPLLRITNVSG
jgi:hypothetical protein